MGGVVAEGKAREGGEGAGREGRDWGAKGAGGLAG